MSSINIQQKEKIRALIEEYMGTLDAEELDEYYITALGMAERVFKGGEYVRTQSFLEWLDKKGL